MTEWFGPELGRWFAYFALFSLLALVAPWVEKGRHKRLVMSLYVGSLGIGCVLLGAGLVARVLEQPTHVVRPLVVTGIVMTAVFGLMLGVVRSRYGKAEERRILARDM